jgi:hypothetical protein
MSILELLSCNVACKAGSNCLRRFGSWSNGGIGDCGTGETGTAETDVGGQTWDSVQKQKWKELCKNVIPICLLM